MDENFTLWYLRNEAEEQQQKKKGTWAQGPDRDSEVMPSWPACTFSEVYFTNPLDVS